MKGIANSILATLIVSICVLSFTNCILFFPWYLTLVYETFNLSVRSANVNCITTEMIQDVYDELGSKPLYRDYKGDLKVCLNKAEVKTATPYTQRGVTYHVGIQAKFPLVLRVFGREYRFTTPVSLHIPTTGTRYYKDLP
ncbi:MAG: hypothetical protein N2489_02135 [Clostridia bacterium]|nr:hypothetical protein [Clostridia bacterium]